MRLRGDDKQIVIPAKAGIQTVAKRSDGPCQAATDMSSASINSTAA